METCDNPFPITLLLYWSKHPEFLICQLSAYWGKQVTLMSNSGQSKWELWLLGDPYPQMRNIWLSLASWPKIARYVYLFLSCLKLYFPSLNVANKFKCFSRTLYWLKKKKHLCWHSGTHRHPVCDLYLCIQDGIVQLSLGLMSSRIQI